MGAGASASKLWSFSLRFLKGWGVGQGGDGQYNGSLWSILILECGAGSVLRAESQMKEGTDSGEDCGYLKVTDF